MGKLYLDNGYPNIDYIWDSASNFVTVTSSRGTGKTYGVAKRAVEIACNGGGKFVWLRRWGTQILKARTPVGNPFARLNKDMGWNVQAFSLSADMVAFYEAAQNKRGKIAPDGALLGVGTSLSALANVRGMDFSGFDTIVFDEYIPLTTERTLTNEFTAFLDFYETVNRNRELQGLAPVKALLLGNANQLANPYYIGWDFMSTAIKMIRGKQMIYRTPDGSRAMIILQDSPISRRKMQTGLYKNAPQDFIEMAINNAFYVDPTRVASRPLIEFDYLCTIGTIGIYRHKSRREFYICRAAQKTRAYDPQGFGLEQWRKRYGLMKTLYFENYLTFDSYDTELIFRGYLGMI